jgi:hypothetical protein
MNKGLFLIFAISSVLPLTKALAQQFDDYQIVDSLGGNRDGLYEFSYHRTTPDLLGPMDVNPYVLFDMGLIPTLNADSSQVSNELASQLLITYGNGELVKTYFRQREGRAKPLAPRVIQTFSSGQPMIVRGMQKGGFFTQKAGGHKDGLLDLSEAYGDMIWGEVLHQNGALTTRGMLAARQNGVKRNMEYGQGLDAGIIERIGELPRLREPGGWFNNYQDRMLSTVRYQHPLIIGGLQTLDPKQLNWFLALHNEALLKDLWVLHGSYTFDENRSAALIDFGTTSALWEPNPKASLGYTSYEQEIAESANHAAERMGDDGRSVPTELRTVKVRGLTLFNNVYWSSYAFFQLRRVGLSDAQILKHFTRERVPGTQFDFYFADDATLAFARNIAEIDKQTMYSPEPYTVDWQDQKSVSTHDRVIVNTRKLLRNIVETGLLRIEQPTSVELQAAIKMSLFGTQASQPDQIMGYLNADTGKGQYVFAKVNEVVHYFKTALQTQIDSDRLAVSKRALAYPIEQTMPYRRQVMDMAWHWANNPGTFAKEFVPWIEARSPSQGPVAEQRLAHLKKHLELESLKPKDFLGKVAGSCRTVFL